jgi:outer membrane protein assembly factor BamB
VVGDTVVVGAQDKALHAFGTADGERRLRAETGGAIESQPAVPDDGEVVHVHSTDGDCYGIDLTDGIQWTVESTSSDGDLGRRGAVLLWLTDPRDTESYALQAFRATDGTPLWDRAVATYRLPTGAGSRTVVPVSAADPDASTPTTRAVALDTTDGATVWSKGYDYPPSVAADADLVAVLGRTEEGVAVAGYDPADGTRRWRTPVERDPAVGRNPMLGPHVVVTTHDEAGAAVGFDRETGDVAWRQSPAGQIRNVATGPETTVVARRVQRDDETRMQLQSYDADGGRRWTTVVELSDAEGAAVAGSTVLVDDGSRLATLDAETGETRWQYESAESYGLAVAATADAAFVSHVDTGELVRLSL